MAARPADREQWQVAESLGCDPRPYAALLYQCPGCRAARDRLQQFVIGPLGRRGSGWSMRPVFSEGRTQSGWRRYWGGRQAGKWASGDGLELRGQGRPVSGSMAVPARTWAAENDVPARAPEEVRFETKPEQAIAMLVHAWERRAHAVVTAMRSTRLAPSAGNRPAHGRFYVLAVSADTRVWTQRPAVEEPRSKREDGHGVRYGWLQRHPKPEWLPQ